MTTVTFLQPRLTGSRFDDHSIPLEFLTDFSVLKEMLAEVAKWRYLEAHSGRKRTPRKFMEGISLKLYSIEDGSASPVIKLVVAGGLLFGQAQVYFEEARDAIVSAISAAEHGTDITSLPEKYLRYFDRFGRSLKDGEAIEFPVTGGGNCARLTKETRRTLVLAASGVNEVTEEIIMYGVIPEADQERMTFTIHLPDGKRISAPIPKEHFETIVEAFNGYKAGTRVRLEGTGKFSKNDRPLAISSISSVSVLEPLDISARLDEMKYLKDGWLDGEGASFLEAGLDWLAGAFAGYYPDEPPLPHLYPTVEGRVRAEWTVAPHEISLEIDLVNHSAMWHDWNSNDDSEVPRTLNLDTESEWAWIGQRIRELSEGAS